MQKLLKRWTELEKEEVGKKGQSASEKISSPKIGERRDKTEDVLEVSKKNFVLFMAEVINYTAPTEKRTEKIQIIVKAAERFLDGKDLT